MGLAPIYIPAALAAANLHYQSYEGRKSEKTQEGRQRQAQASAESAAASQIRQSEENYNRVNRKQPDIPSILLGEQAAGGLGSSLLSGGRNGADSSNLLLGRRSLLGG